MKKRYSLLLALALAAGLELPVPAWAEIVSGDNANNIALTADTTYTVNDGTGPFTFSGIISDGGSAYGITKDGAGKLIFTGANTYTGTTTISEGALQLSVADATGSIDSYKFAGTGTLVLAMSASDTIVASNFDDFTGTVQLVKVADNNTKLNAAGTTLTGKSGITLDVTSGSQLFSNGDSACAVRIIGTGNQESRGAIRLSGGTLSGPVTLTGDANIGLEGGAISGGISGTASAGSTQTLSLGTNNSQSSGTFSGIISDGASGGKLAINVTKGSPVFTGANTYTGGTIISGGTLTAQNASALGIGTVTVNSGASLKWNLDTDLTYTISGAGSLIFSKNRSGNYTYGLASHLSDFTGTIVLQGQNRLEMGALTNAFDACTFDVRAQSEFWASSGTTNANFLIAGNGNGVFDTATRGAIRMEGTPVFNGTVKLTANASIGMANAGTGTFNGAMDVAGFELKFGQGYQDGGSVVITGNVSDSSEAQGGSIKTVNALTGSASNYSLKFGADSAADAESPTTQTISVPINHAAASLVFQPGENRTTVLSGVLSGAGAISKTGAGTLELTAANTYTSNLAVNVGTVKVSGAGNLGATTSVVNLASAGTLDWSLVSDLTNPVSGAGTILLSGNRGTDSAYSYGLSSALNAFTGTVRVAGTNIITWSEATAPISGVTFDILSGNQFVAQQADAVYGSHFILQGTGINNEGALKIAANSTFAGNIAGAAENPGALIIPNDAAIQVKLGASADAASGAGTTQTIGANIQNANTTSALTFDVGANQTTTVSGVISGAGAILKTGTGTVNLNARNTLTGTVTVEEGQLNVNAAFDNTSRTGGLPATTDLVVGSTSGEAATLKLAQKAIGDHGGSVTVYKGGTIEMAGSDTSIGNNKGINFIGGGSITGSGYFWLRGNGAQALTVTGEDAHVNIAANMYIYSGTNTINIVEPNSDMTFGGTMNQWDRNTLSGNLAKTGAGNLILTKNNSSLNGTFTVEEGTLTLTGDGSLSTMSSVVVADGAKIVVNNSIATALPASFAPAAGTIGGTGTINRNFAVTGSAIVAPGDNSIGTLTIGGDFSLTASDSVGELAIEILNDPDAGPLNDVLNVTGAATLEDTTIHLTGATGFKPVVPGQSFDIITAGSFVGDVLDSITFKTDENLIDSAYPEWNLSVVQLSANTYALRAEASYDHEKVPEPATWGLLILGLFGLWRLRGKRNE